MREIFKYLLIIIVITANIDKFSSENSSSTKIFTAIFIIVLVLIILFLFKQSNKPKATSRTNFNNHSPKVILKKDLTEAEFKNRINSQLNSLLKKQKEILWVGDEHRTHPWSIEPGGSTVVVLFIDQKCLGYDKVKRPDRYTMKISTDYISNNFSNVQYDTLEKYIKGIYLSENGRVDLKTVWDSNTKLSPWGILEKYRTK